jgi:hypothetical protein
MQKQRRSSEFSMVGKHTTCCGQCGASCRPGRFALRLRALVLRGLPAIGRGAGAAEMFDASDASLFLIQAGELDEGRSTPGFSGLKATHPGEPAVATRLTRLRKQHGYRSRCRRRFSLPAIGGWMRESSTKCNCCMGGGWAACCDDDFEWLMNLFTIILTIICW